MPELFLDIKLGLDDSTKKTVQSEIQDIQDRATKASSASTSATNKEANAKKDLLKWEREVSKEMRASIRLNEERFRRGEITQQQALETAQAMEEEAKMIGLVNFETARGKQNFAAFGNSMRRLDSGFTGMAQTSARANQSLMNLGRIVQDLPFGFLGISNNIDPALQSFKSLREEAGSNIGAFKLLLGALKGSGGLIFALGSLLPTAVLIATQGFNMYRKRTDDSADATSNLTDKVRDFISESTGLREESSFLGIDRIEQRIKSIGRLDLGIQRITEVTEEYNRQVAQGMEAAMNQPEVQRDVIEAYNIQFESLEELERQFGLTSEDVEILREELENLEGQLRRSQALFRRDLTAQFRQGIEQTTEEFIWQAENSFILSDRLQKQAEAYELHAESLREDALTNEDARIKYNALKEAIDELNSAYDKLNPEQKESKQTTEEEIPVILQWAAAYQKRIEATRKFRIEQQKLIENLPEARGEDFGPETRALSRMALIEQMQSDRQISQAEGLNQKRLEIERSFQQRKIELAKQGLLDQDVLRELELTKEQQLEQAKTEIARQGEEKRKQLRKQALDSSFAIANNFISSLMQLNQAQSDESEQQARKRFETQKKLQKAQAVVSGAAAIVKTFSEWGYPFGIPFAAAQAAATAVQLAAIERTEFNSASQSGSSAQTGFFETDAKTSNGQGQRQPMKPESSPTINVSLEGEFDDEMVHVKAKRGEDKRKRGTVYPVG